MSRVGIALGVLANLAATAVSVHGGYYPLAVISAGGFLFLLAVIASGEV